MFLPSTERERGALLKTGLRDGLYALKVAASCAEKLGCSERAYSCLCGGGLARVDELRDTIAFLETVKRVLEESLQIDEHIRRR